jgi:hypothetical protein
MQRTVVRGVRMYFLILPFCFLSVVSFDAIQVAIPATFYKGRGKNNVDDKS